MNLRNRAVPPAPFHEPPAGVVGRQNQLYHVLREKSEANPGDERLSERVWLLRDAKGPE